MQIKIFVEGPDRTQNIVIIDDAATVGELKEQVEELLNGKIWTLCFGGRHLTYSKTLRECNLKDFSTITVVPRPGCCCYKPSKSSDPNSKIRIYLHSGRGYMLMLDIYPTVTIGELKQTVKEGYGYSISVIVHCGKILKDDSKTLHYYRIGNNCSLIFVEKLCKDSRIRVYIKGTERDKQALTIKDTATIEEFEQQVEIELGVTIIVTVFGGKILEDKAKTLEEYEIKQNSYIQIIEKLNENNENDG